MPRQGLPDMTTREGRSGLTQRLAERGPVCPDCHAPAEPGSRNRISSTHVEYHCPRGCGYFGVVEPGVNA